MTAIFLYPKNLEQHPLPENHPLKAERTRLTYDLCRKFKFFRDESKEVAASKDARVEDLLAFHDPAYIELLKKAGDGNFSEEMIKFGLGSGDCPIFKGLFDYCLVTAGATLTAANIISEKRADIVFNSSGGLHHAQKNYAEGFCYVNDVVLGILSLLKNGFRRIAYIDIDAHHGNGVQNAFYSDNRVLTISIHESGATLYPGKGFEDEIGEGDGRGFNINLPILPLTDDDSWMALFSEIVPPLVEKFSPDAIVTQLGADTLAADPLTHLSLTNNGICRAVKLMKSFKKPWLVLGGGGYNVRATVRAWALAWSIMNGTEPKDDYAGNLGGVFMGSHEISGRGLFDMHVVTTGPDKKAITKNNKKVADYIKKIVFPLHRI